MSEAPNWTRRQWLLAGSAGALLSRLSLSPYLARPIVPKGSHIWATDPTDVKALALRAVDVARSAGATYADVRLTRTEVQSFAFGTSLQPEQEMLAIGVRALKNGYWGFAASARWDVDEAVQLAHDAVEQAKTNALGTPREVDLGSYPTVQGSWATPVRIDPFKVPIEEKIDLMRSWLEFADRFRPGVSGDRPSTSMSFVRQEHILATTEGTYCTQTLYNSSGSFGIMVGPTDWRDQGTERVEAKGLLTAGMGWEMFLDAELRDQIPEMVESGKELRKLRRRTVSPGRYDVVFDGAMMAAMLDATIGTASELGLAMGHEANRGGTSYLAHPLELLGTYRAGAPLITVTGNRSANTQLATVKWDGEGVEPDDFTIVKDGILVDYQTTRESATWLAQYYTKNQLPIRSHGCAWADSAQSITTQCHPNLALLPATTDTGLDELISNVKNGIAILGGHVSMDFQANTGVGSRDGSMREIVDGKLGYAIANGSFRFNAPELWNSVSALAGAKSVEAIPVITALSESQKMTGHTVSAPAAIVDNVVIVDQRGG